MKNIATMFIAPEKNKNGVADNQLIFAYYDYLKLLGMNYALRNGFLYFTSLIAKPSGSSP